MTGGAVECVAEATREAINTLREKGAKAFVMDIRNNGGGLFPSGVEISKMFYNQGTIVYIADQDGA